LKQTLAAAGERCARNLIPAADDERGGRRVGRDLADDVAEQLASAVEPLDANHTAQPTTKAASTESTFLENV
jgi:hypothetical protein